MTTRGPYHDFRLCAALAFATLAGACSTMETIIPNSASQRAEAGVASHNAPEVEVGQDRRPTARRRRFWNVPSSRSRTARRHRVSAVPRIRRFVINSTSSTPPGNVSPREVNSA